MKMSHSDREKILEAGKFLEELGYEVYINKYSVRYSDGKIIFSVGYEKYDDMCDVDITFLKHKEHFIIGWIWVVRKGGQLINTEKSIDKILMLMEYVKNNYEKVTNIEWCQESRRMINEFFERRNNEA